MRYRKTYDIKVRGVIARSGARLYEIEESGRKGYVDAEHFAKNPADALAGLVSVGLTFLGPKRTRLLEYLADVEDFEEVNLFDRVGHNGAQFVHGDGRNFSPPDEEPGEIIFSPPANKFHQSGTLEGWLTGVAERLVGHRICEFFMAIPFAGPLRSYTRRSMNFGWELAGVGAAGKTVLLQLMCSTCGGSLGGEEGNFGLSFAATNAGLEWEMQNYSDLFIPIDESNQFAADVAEGARARAFIKLVMDLSKGEERHRYRTTSRTFKYVFATTANEPLLDIIGGRSAKSVVDAVTDRLMTIPVPNRETGIFDLLPAGYDDVGDLFADLVTAASANHGLAMPNFLQKMVCLAAAERQVFVDRIEHHIAKFRHEARIEANAGSATRVADAFGLVYAAGRLAKHFGSLPSAFDPLTSTLECYRLYRSAFQPESSAAEILCALLEDLDVIDLDKTPLPEMSKSEFNDTKAFRKTNRKGELELLIPPPSIVRLLPGWNRIRRDDFEIARIIRREDERHTVQRRVRQGGPASGDRVVCIVLGDTTAQSLPERPKAPPTKQRRNSRRGRRRRK